MEISKKAVESFKKLMKDKYNKEYTDREAYEGASSLLGFYNALIKSAESELRKKRKLKEFPKGFHVDDGTYNCRVCRRHVTGEESWYDKYGVKCMTCQKALDEGVIPSFICINNDSFYRTWELERKFGIKHQTARKFVREGSLKARIILNEEGKPYEYIFLKKENAHLVDPDRHSSARKSYEKYRKKD